MPTSDIKDASDLVRSLVSVPESEIDLLRSALMIDHYVDPTVDIEKNYRQIQTIAEKLEELVGEDASDIDKISAIRTLIYKSGPWNSNEPFSYDFDNPQGRLAKHKTLNYYLTTRRGNCVSMPMLFLMLAEQLGVEMSLITAPQHLLIQYKDAKTGKLVNLETTSGANPSRPEWLRTQRPFTDRAVQSGMYLKPLTKKQMVAVMASTILQQLYGEDKDWQEDIEVAIEIIDHYPEMDVPQIHIALSAYNLIQENYRSKYQTPAEMPSDVYEKYMDLQYLLDVANGRLKSLGYQGYNSSPIALSE